MSRFNLSGNIPVNLIQKPIEQTAVLVWLVAFAQFFSYGFIDTMTPTLGWLLSAPALMLASIVIAARTQNSFPLLVTFISGVLVVFFQSNAHMGTGLLWRDLSGLSGISVYTLLFWIISSYFLRSNYFVLFQRIVQVNESHAVLSVQFEKFIFYLSFISLNICIALSFFQQNYIIWLNLTIVIIFLFVAGRHISGTLRGILLPVYVSLLLSGVLENGTDSQFYNLDSHTFLIFSFLLWIGHNFISRYYNKLFPEVTVNTSLWPWFGLFLLVICIFDLKQSTFYEPSSWMVVIGYLFLMLRNTTSGVIIWSVILLISWLILVVLSPINPMLFSLKELSWLGYYGLQSLSFILALLLFNLLWNRYINHYFLRLGWQKVSFKRPVIAVNLLVIVLWLIISTVLAVGLITDWFNLIDEGLNIEKTSFLLVLTLFSVTFFINNRLLANLMHFSTIVLLVVLWGLNKPVPVYMMFAFIHLLWVLLPTFLERFSGRLLNQDFKQCLHNLVKTSGNWIYVSFAAAVVSLFYMADNARTGVDSFVFLFSVGILFLASILLARRHTQQLWIVFCYLLASGMVISLRIMIMGSEPINALDTTGLLIISFLMYAINHYRKLASPIISSDILVKLLPLTSIFTLSWQTASIHSSVTLSVLGIFYLLIQKTGRFALYSGVVFINLAVYLWIPMVSDYTNLLLFYITPVSMSMLLITHLHKDEIKPGLKNRIRFLALSILYLVVTADVFINETLAVFLLGLLLGISSVIYGISSKTRAFLYSGVAFLVINILGQLIVFYPDGRLGRALILMTTGAVITGTMIWFNIKREMLLEKIKVFRADLDKWN